MLNQAKGIIMVLVMLLLLGFALLGIYIHILLEGTFYRAMAHKWDVEQYLHLNDYLQRELSRVQTQLLTGEDVTPVHLIGRAQGCQRYLVNDYKMLDGHFLDTPEPARFSSVLFELMSECRTDFIRRVFDLWVGGAGDQLRLRAHFSVEAAVPVNNPLWLDGQQYSLVLAERADWALTACRVQCNQLGVLLVALDDTNTRSPHYVDHTEYNNGALGYENYFIALNYIGDRQWLLVDRLGGLWQLWVDGVDDLTFKRYGDLAIMSLVDSGYQLERVAARVTDEGWQLDFILSSKGNSVLYRAAIAAASLHPYTDYQPLLLNGKTFHETLIVPVITGEYFDAQRTWRMNLAGHKVVELGYEDRLLVLLALDEQQEEWLWVVGNDGQPYMAENIYAQARATAAQSSVVTCLPTQVPIVLYNHWIVGCRVASVYNYERYY